MKLTRLVVAGMWGMLGVDNDSNFEGQDIAKGGIWAEFSYKVPKNPVGLNNDYSVFFFSVNS